MEYVILNEEAADLSDWIFRDKTQPLNEQKN